MNLATSACAPKSRVPPSTGVIASPKGTNGSRAATTALALEQYQRLLKRRLGKPLQDLFHQLTGLRLHLWWHKPGPELSPGAVRKLCPRLTQGRAAKRAPACEECLRECWLPEWSSPQPEKRFTGHCRSEEHTSELQSLRHLVCRL